MSGRFPPDVDVRAISHPVLWWRPNGGVTVRGQVRVHATSLHTAPSCRLDAERWMRDGYDCLMPAAGESLRMGRWKLTMRLENETIVERSVRTALSFCSRVILVAGYRGGELRSLFEGRRSVVVVENFEYRNGMFSSIRSGSRFVETRRFFVALADMPFLPPWIFGALAELLGEPQEPDRAARPSYRNTPGHPVLLPAAAIDKIQQFDNSHSMQDVLLGLRVARLDTEEAGVVSDIDTPRDTLRYGVGPG